MRNRALGVQEDRSQGIRLAAYAPPRWSPRPAANPPTAMEAEPTKVSIKTMKEVIRSAGLATADLLEKRDIEARYKQAQARLEEAERLERQKNQPKKRHQIPESSSSDDDGGRDLLIPEATGNKKSNVEPLRQVRVPGGRGAHAVDEQAPRRPPRRYGATRGRARPTWPGRRPRGGEAPRPRSGAAPSPSEEEEEEEAEYLGDTDDDSEEDEMRRCRQTRGATSRSLLMIESRSWTPSRRASARAS